MRLLWRKFTHPHSVGDQCWDSTMHSVQLLASREKRLLLWRGEG